MNWTYEVGHHDQTTEENIITEGIDHISTFDNLDAAKRYYLAHPGSYMTRYRDVPAGHADTTDIENRIKGLREQIKVISDGETKKNLWKTLDMETRTLLMIENRGHRQTEIYDKDFKMFKPIGSHIEMKVNEETGEVKYRFVLPQIQNNSKKKNKQ